MSAKPTVVFLDWVVGGVDSVNVAKRGADLGAIIVDQRVAKLEPARQPPVGLLNFCGFLFILLLRHGRNGQLNTGWFPTPHVQRCSYGCDMFRPPPYAERSARAGQYRGPVTVCSGLFLAATVNVDM